MPDAVLQEFHCGFTVLELRFYSMPDAVLQEFYYDFTALALLLYKRCNRPFALLRIPISRGQHL